MVDNKKQFGEGCNEIGALGNCSELRDDALSSRSRLSNCLKIKSQFGFLLIGIMLLSTFSFPFMTAAAFGGELKHSFSTSGTGGFAGGGQFFGGGSNYQYAQPSFNTYYSDSQIGEYWPILSQIENGECEATQDFLIGIPPGGCSPMVVRSDILEEQNVPVFCQLDAVRVNPLVKVSSIESISFKGDYPEGVAGVSFHPARAAIRSYNSLLGNPILSNIGYVVIILEREKVEDNMEDWIAGNLTATIRYDAEEAYGVGRNDFYLPTMQEEDWNKDYQAYNFWNGKGYVRITGIGQGTADIALYDDKDNVYRSLTLREGETSSTLYFPGFYCRAGLNVKLNKIEAIEDTAKLYVDGSEIWVRDGSSFLNGDCRVKDLDALKDGTGSVEISCRGNDLDLVLQRYAAKINGEAMNAGDSVGYGKIEGAGSNQVNWYLGYVGKVPSNVGQIGGKDMVLLMGASKSLDNEDIGNIAEQISEIEEKGEGISAEKFKSEIGKPNLFSFQNKPSKVLTVGDVATIEGDNEKKGISFEGLEEGLTEKNHDAVTEGYLTKSMESVTDLFTDLPAEERLTGEKYSETEIVEEIKLLGKMGKFKTQKNLIEVFLEKFPDSDYGAWAKSELEKIQYYNAENSFGTVFVNNKYHSISVAEFSPVDDSKKSTRISVGGNTQTMNEGDRITFGVDSKYILVNEIQPNKVALTYHYLDGGEAKKKSYSISLEESEFIDERQVTVRDIDVEEVAYVSLIPEVENTKTEANFTFKIGIEKRAIELSPEKTKDMINNLNKTINDWEELNEKFAGLIKAWKGACFATSTLLMLKSVASGFSGETLARQAVMGQFEERCATEPELKDMTKTQCYNKLSSEINAAVADYQKAIEGTNEELSSSIGKYASEGEGLFGDRSITDNNAYLKDIKTKYGEGNVNVVTPEGNKEYSINDAQTSEQVAAAMTLKRLKDSGANQAAIDAAQKAVDDKWHSVFILKKAEETKQSVRHATGGLEVSFGESDARKKNYWNGERANINVEGIKEGDPIQGFYYKGERYIAKLNEQGRDLIIEKVYSVGSGGSLSEVTDEKLRKEIIAENVIVTGGECSNPWQDGQATVRYYESGALRGMPAMVPFDLKNGWYVKVPNSAGTFLDGVQGYQKSGDVSYFTICNVGRNRISENGAGDDLCQSFDVNTYANVGKFLPCPSMSSENVQGLAVAARQAIRDAQNQYGQPKVTVRGLDGRETYSVDVGNPMSDTGDYECQDFMSPEDCQLMFNVCDPVICPTSRCDLGGKMPVDNVVQTGIIGSIMLCLPNAREGIAVPVCLTGIQAGIDSLISIMKSGRECLQKSLETGEHVGICDEITSIYLCEFFWRQVAPVMDLLIPKFIELSYGNQGVRGGGEYMTVQHAWDNIEKSVDYFQNNYAQTAFQAFQFRNVEEAGGEFCRAFIGTSVPTSADIVDNLLEPESPYQFTAWFDEKTFSDATVPATSQYKVYYNIYAGKDRGVSYQVYLKDPPAASYYRSTPEILVKTGYIARGEAADESIDFTAPQGYKQLCVVINGKEECGFKQVSTDFALDYLSDKYVEDQAGQTGITTEKECISGSPSGYSLVNPNLQAGAEEVINPEIAMRGIVRVCATANPSAIQFAESEGNKEGEDSDTENGPLVIDSRWKEVGYCGDSNLKCWLDTESVKDNLDRVAKIENKTISVLGEESEDILENERESQQQAKEILTRMREKINGLRFTGGETGEEIELQIEGIVSELRNIAYVAEEGVGYPNGDKAESMSLLAGLYRKIVQSRLGKGAREGQAPVEKVKEDLQEEEVVVLAFDDGTPVGEESYPEVLEGIVLSSELEILEDGQLTGFSLEEAGGTYSILEIQKRWGFDYKNTVGVISGEGRIGIIENEVSDEGKSFIEKLKRCTFEFSLNSFVCD